MVSKDGMVSKDDETVRGGPRPHVRALLYFQTPKKAEGQQQQNTERILSPLSGPMPPVPPPLHPLSYPTTSAPNTKKALPLGRASSVEVPGSAPGSAWGPAELSGEGRLVAPIPHASNLSHPHR